MVYTIYGFIYLSLNFCPPNEIQSPNSTRTYASGGVHFVVPHVQLSLRDDQTEPQKRSPMFQIGEIMIEGHQLTIPWMNTSIDVA